MGRRNIRTSGEEVQSIWGGRSRRGDVELNFKMSPSAATAVNLTLNVDIKNDTYLFIGTVWQAKTVKIQIRLSF